MCNFFCFRSISESIYYYSKQGSGNMNGKERGFVIEPRDIMDNEWYTEPLTMHLYRHCRLRANYADAKWQGIEIKRGQFITSLSTLSNETGLSVMQIRTALGKLKKTGYITNKSTKKYRIITVLGYDEEQIYNKEINKQITNSQQTVNSMITTDNNNNKKNKNNNRITAPKRFDNSGIKKRGASYDINELNKIDTLDFMDEPGWQEKTFGSHADREDTAW